MKSESHCIWPCKVHTVPQENTHGRLPTPTQNKGVGLEMEPSWASASGWLDGDFLFQISIAFSGPTMEVITLLSRNGFWL